MDVLDLGWKGVSITLNGNKINLPKPIMIKFQDKLKMRCIIKENPLLFHIMLKQGFTWFIMTSNNPPETVYINPDILPEMPCDLSPQCNFLYGLFNCQLPEVTIDIEITVRTLKCIHNFRQDCATQSS